VRNRLVLAFTLLLAAAASVARADEEKPAPALKLMPPRLLNKVEAAPPASLAERGRVEVVLEIDVDDKGRTASVKVVEPSPFPGEGYEEAAVAAVRQYTWQAGTADGKPVPVRITYRYVFFMKPVEPPPPPPDGEPGDAPAVPAGPTVPVAGQVLSRGDRLPQARVTVVVDDNLLVAETDEEGRFKLDAVPVGERKLRLRGGNILDADIVLNLTEGKGIEAKYYVAARERYTSTVRGRRVVQETVEYVLSGEEVRKIPGTQGDAIKAVQNLPGIARAPFGGGLLAVWGSAPLDTRTYVDGIFIPVNFHFFGLRATISSEIVQNVAFRPGAFGVEYGRGMGGVIEIETRPPKDKGYHGFFQLDLIDASAMFEAKLPKNLTLSIGLRRSTLDAWLPILTPNTFQLTPSYWDYHAKLHFAPNPRHELTLFVFGSDDQIRLVARNPDPTLQGQFDSHIFYHRVLLRYLHRFGKNTFTVTAAAGCNQPFQFGGQFGNFNLRVDAFSTLWAVRAVVRAPLTPWLRLDAGVDYEGNEWRAGGNLPIAGAPREGDPPGFNGGGGFVSIESRFYANHVAPFVALNFSLLDNRLLIVPQLRFELYTFTGNQGTPDAFTNVAPRIEPRLNLRYQIAKWMAVKAGVGIFTQPPDPQVFLPFLGNFDAAPTTSVHYVFGFEWKPTATLEINAQVFYKELRDLIVRATDPGEPTLFNGGIGRVYGADFLIRQQLWKGLFGWLSYTILRSERKDHPDEPWRLFQFDQTHILTLIASYKLPRGFQVGLRFRYVTGNPSTPVVGASFDANDGGYDPIRGPTHSARVPDFHQLDVRFDKTWTFRTWKLALYLDVQNVYYNVAPEGFRYNFDRSRVDFIAGLPIVPSLGIRGDF
jgi:TonB family protein